MRILLILPLMLAGCLTPGENSSTSTYNVGQRSYKFEDTERQRPLDVEVWYPTYDTLTLISRNEKEIFKPISSIQNAGFAEGQFPLLIVSHGTGGNRFSLTWLIERMVKEGYMVVSLGHYGNTTFYKLPREFVKWWERAIDIKFVLGKILENEELKSRIRQENIGGIGFSLGGYTHIALAGGLVDRTYPQGDKENEKRELPPEFPRSDEVIDFENDSLIVASYEKYKNKVKDERIKAFFVMAPAIGFGFHSKQQTENITAPVFIVAGKGDTNTPIKFNALNYDQLIPTSSLHLLGENVDHYVFLNEGTEFGKEVAPQITVDNEGVDRKQVHDEVARLAITFFEKHLR